MNGAYFDPETHTLIISARIEDLSMCDEEPDRVAITVQNLDEGVELHWPHERLWYPVREA